VGLDADAQLSAEIEHLLVGDAELLGELVDPGVLGQTASCSFVLGTAPPEEGAF